MLSLQAYSWLAAIMLVWCASLGYVRVSTKRVYIPHEARSAQISALFESSREPLESNTIFGILNISCVQPYDFMKVYSESERLQMRFWNAILDTMDKDDIQLFTFSVGSGCRLPEPVSLLQCSDRKLRGLVSQLEPGQAQRIWTLLPDEFQAKHEGIEIPTVALRMPPQHAVLLAEQRWQNLCLPNVMQFHRKRGGSKTLFIDWASLGLRPAAAAPSYDALCVAGSLSLNKDTSAQVADALRSFAHCLISAGQDDFAAAEHANIVRLTEMMTDVQEQLDPTFFLKACKDLRNRASLRSLNDTARCNLKYNVMWLVQVLVMSDCVRDASQLADVVLQAVRMILPPVVRAVFEEALKDGGFCLPHKGTVSRWRCLFDGAFMLWQRRQNSGEPFLRWMMSDSSTQHGRTFQLMSVLSLRESSARRAMFTATDLVNLWRLLRI